ncbi:MAG: RNA-binding transcriptional accessory protein, partial [Flavobacteriales bacterium]
IVTFKAQYEALEKRKKAILKALEEQEVLTPELKKTIESTDDLVTLEDIYLPFKKSRKTKAETARKNGLEPLAKIIMAQNSAKIEHIASQYVGNDVPNEDDALEGARHIISEWINERLDIRNQIRNQLE